MNFTVEEKLTNVLSNAPSLQEKDPVAVIIMMLLEMGFQPHVDGFAYLIDAILIKSKHLKMRMGAVYDEIIASSEEVLSTVHLEQAIRNSIKKAWKSNARNKWLRYFSEEEIGAKYPSNKVFISKMAYVVEVMYRCGK